MATQLAGASAAEGHSLAYALFDSKLWMNKELAADTLANDAVMAHLKETFVSDAEMTKIFATGASMKNACYETEKVKRLSFDFPSVITKGKMVFKKQEALLPPVLQCLTLSEYKDSLTDRSRVLPLVNAMGGVRHMYELQHDAAGARAALGLPADVATAMRKGTGPWVPKDHPGARLDHTVFLPVVPGGVTVELAEGQTVEQALAALAAAILAGTELGEGKAVDPTSFTYGILAAYILAATPGATKAQAWTAVETVCVNWAGLAEAKARDTAPGAVALTAEAVTAAARAGVPNADLEAWLGRRVGWTEGMRGMARVSYWALTGPRARDMTLRFLVEGLLGGATDTAWTVVATLVRHFHLEGGVYVPGAPKARDLTDVQEAVDWQEERVKQEEAERQAKRAKKEAKETQKGIKQLTTMASGLAGAMQSMMVVQAMGMAMHGAVLGHMGAGGGGAGGSGIAGQPATPPKKRKRDEAEDEEEDHGDEEDY